VAPGFIRSVFAARRNPPRVTGIQRRSMDPCTDCSNALRWMGGRLICPGWPYCEIHHASQVILVSHGNRGNLAQRQTVRMSSVWPPFLSTMIRGEGAVKGSQPQRHLEDGISDSTISSRLKRLRPGSDCGHGESLGNAVTAENPRQSASGAGIVTASLVIPA